MKNILLISILYLISLSVMSQKVTIQVIKTGNAALSEWQILDKQYRPVFPGSEYFKQDSVSFTLEANERYLLEISVSEIYNPDTSLYSLLINGEPVMLINAKIESGDHFYPFFTGTKAVPTKIIGGTNANIADFPWQVYFISGPFLCGGSIIDQNWVVTAAHCTKDSNGNPISPSSMHIMVGSSTTSGGKVYNVSNAIVHSGFNPQTLNNDIALLQIAGPINYTNASPIKLVSPNDVAAGATDPGVMAWVTGWGLIRVTPQTLPSNLQKVQLPIVSNAQAAVVWGTIPLTDIMAGYLNGTKDACNGDSGGPLVVPVFNEYKLAGLVSWGSQNCDTYGGYTSILALEEWIYSNTGIPQNYTPAAPVGDTLICQGISSTQYTLGTITGATSYEWQLSPPNAGVITGSSNIGTVVWTPGYTGSAIIGVRATVNGTISEWSQLNVKVALNTKLISQSRDTALCSGQPVSFIINATGDNLIYNWYKNGILLQSGNSGIFNISGTTAVSTGGYICNVSGSCGTWVSNTINLTVHPLTNITYISPETQVAFGQNAAIEVKSDGYNLSYQWQKNDTLLDNSNTAQLVLQDVNATNIGLYRATVMGACGTEISDSIYVYVKRANYSNEPEIFLWPTITNDILNVALSNDGFYNIRIYSSLGILIKEQLNCRYKTAISLANIPSGMYIVDIYNSNFQKSLRVIKR